MELTAADREALRQARALLEQDSWVSKLSGVFETPIEAGLKRLPARWQTAIHSATRAALEKALHVALATVRDPAPAEASAGATLLGPPPAASALAPVRDAVAPPAAELSPSPFPRGRGEDSAFPPQSSKGEPPPARAPVRRRASNRWHKALVTATGARELRADPEVLSGYEQDLLRRNGFALHTSSPSPVLERILES
jgi:hypothetical protein